MIDYVVKLTKDATKVWKDDHEKLRAAGFEDQVDGAVVKMEAPSIGQQTDLSARVHRFFAFLPDSNGHGFSACAVTRFRPFSAKIIELRGRTLSTYPPKAA